MRNILVVGPVEYDILDAMAKRNPDVIFFREQSIYWHGPEQLIALVDIFDGVLFSDHVDECEKTSFEVACIMNHVAVLTMADFPTGNPEETASPVVETECKG